jgi:HK97 gp10 family phage protein
MPAEVTIFRAFYQEAIGNGGNVEDRTKRALKTQAAALADAIRAAAPRQTGNLAASVRVGELRQDRRGVWSITVKAGGELTTKEVRSGSGVPYDYANATEFGTEKEAAEPFFYPTYRARRNGIRHEIESAVSDGVSDVSGVFK